MIRIAASIAPAILFLLHHGPALAHAGPHHRLHGGALVLHLAGHLAPAVMALAALLAILFAYRIALARLTRGT